MSGQGGIQLLPETRRKIDVRIPGENRWTYAGLIMLVLAFALTGILMFYRKSLENKLTQFDSDITNLESQRNKAVETNLLTLNKQLSLTSRLLNEHIFWSKALNRVEALTHPQVQFVSFNATAEEGKFEVKAITHNYTVLAKQIAAYVSDDLIKDINLGDVHVLTSGRLEFSINISFDKAKFIRDK